MRCLHPITRPQRFRACTVCLVAQIGMQTQYLAPDCTFKPLLINCTMQCIICAQEVVDVDNAQYSLSQQYQANKDSIRTGKQFKVNVKLRRAFVIFHPVQTSSFNAKAQPITMDYTCSPTSFTSRTRPF